MRLLLLGGGGQVGTELRTLARLRNINIAAPERPPLDITDGAAIDRLIAEGGWSAVINAAAFTNVDLAESERQAAFAVNAEAPARLAAATARRGIPLIHISTDYVFDGRKGAPYVETDAVGPLNIYGHSKLAGERGVSTANPRHVIVRTSSVYSPYGHNFVKTMLRLAGERDRLTVVADLHHCPTAASDVAKACLDIALACLSAREFAHYGIYHFAGAGETTWFEFAEAIIGAASDRLGKCPQVLPIRTLDYPTPAQRPADSRLDSTAIMRDFGVKLRPWRAALVETLDRLPIDEVAR